jgi:HAD superfamily hydrolase (TIGR01549 family)
MELASTKRQIEPLARPRALLLDMDGTITEPMLDFPRIKAEMGIGQRAILEALAEMTAEARAVAEAILLKHEHAAASGSTLNSGCRELLAWAHTHRLRTALITRNSRASAKLVIERHRLKFDVLITREDGRFKPDPEPLIRACQRLEIELADAWMIGDGSHDVSSGLAAGIRTVWISHGRQRAFDDEPWRTVRDLHELLRLLTDVSYGVACHTRPPP